MKKMRENKGFTLVELIIAMAVGTIVITAATTVMLIGLRIYSTSSKLAMRQNGVVLGISVMEKLIGVASDVNVDGQTIYSGTDELLSVQNGAVVTAGGTAILEGVEAFQPKLVDNLLTVEMKVSGKDYKFSVCCRLVPDETEAPAVFSQREESAEEVLTAAIHDEALTPGVRAFLKVLASQLGSDGRILTENGEGEYYSSWYIGGYEGNPGWSEETPWCVCFISWALEECQGYLKGRNLKFANVDSFLTEFVTSDTWKTSDPQAGDVIFFDWIVDDEKNPEHAGVVLAVRNGWIYTIEGNSNNTVEICRYEADNPYILAYGILDWA